MRGGGGVVCFNMHNKHIFQKYCFEKGRFVFNQSKKELKDIFMEKMKLIPKRPDNVRLTCYPFAILFHFYTF